MTSLVGRCPYFWDRLLFIWQDLHVLTYFWTVSLLKNMIGLFSWVITEPSYLAEALVYLKDFRKVWISQHKLFCNCCFCIIESFLMNRISMPGYLFGSFCFDDFGLTALSNQRGERGKHIAASCPKIFVILNHPQKTAESLYNFRHCYSEDFLHFFNLRLNAILC